MVNGTRNRKFGMRKMYCLTKTMGRNVATEGDITISEDGETTQKYRAKGDSKQFLRYRLPLQRYVLLFQGMDPQNWFPPKLTFQQIRTPWNLFYCKIWTPSEKFGPL